MTDRPSPEAMRRAMATVCKIMERRHPGVRFQPADATDPSGFLVVRDREPVGDGGELGPRERRSDDDAQ